MTTEQPSESPAMFLPHRHRNVTAPRARNARFFSMASRCRFSNRVKPIDPKRPVTTIKSAWDSVRKAAGVECRVHDLRHTALTKMAEADVPESTPKALAGDMSRAMLDRYSHVRLAAKQRAVESLTLATPIIEVPKEVPKVARERRSRIVSK